MSFRRAAKVDKNQKELVKVIRSIGALFLHTHQLKKFCDGITIYRGRTIFTEFKDPVAAEFPKYFDLLTYEQKVEYIIKNHLTEDEKEFYNDVIKYGGTYSVMWNRESVLIALRLT